MKRKVKKIHANHPLRKNICKLIFFWFFILFFSKATTGNLLTKKSYNYSKIVLVLLSASVERFIVSYAGFLIRNKSGVRQKIAEQIELLDIHLLYETRFVTLAEMGRSGLRRIQL